MFNLLLQNKIAAGGILIMLLVGIWYGLNNSSTAGPVLQVEGPIAGDQELVSILLTLRAVNLSGTIFSDPLFVSLQDFGRQILPEPVGRPNPFAPLQSETPVAPPAPINTGTLDTRMFSPGR